MRRAPLVVGDLKALLPDRPQKAHKGVFGQLTLVAGSPDAPGAAILCLLGALRSGVGKLRWAVDEKTYGRARLVPPEAMLFCRALPASRARAQRWATEAIEGSSALVIGPGLGLTRQSAYRLEALVEATRRPCVLDADALTLLAQDARLWRHVGAHCALTPHPKEMARLVGCSIQEVVRAPEEAAYALGRRRGCCVVLKGVPTVVATPLGATFVFSSRGRVALARSGTGDVLAGILGAYLAQGLPVARASCAAVLAHAQAADAASARQTERGLCASDIAEGLRWIG